MITCRELIDFILDYEDGRLPAAQREEFERHLNVCPPCVRYLQSYRQTVELGRQAYQQDASELPPEVPDELVRAILAARKKG